MKKISWLAIVLGASIVGCAGTGPDSEYRELVSRAENEIKLANKAGFLWSNTEDFLKDSQKAHADGDLDKAMKLAKKALDEAIQAQKQAQANANPKIDYTYR